MSLKIGVWIVFAGLTLPVRITLAVEVETSENLKQKRQVSDAGLPLARGIAAEAKSDNKEAARWYQLASVNGFGVADLLLGMLHETGEGVPQSYELARLCYERAIGRGVEAANLRLGILYLEGWGVEVDRIKMAKLITRAAESGYVPAMDILSGMYVAGVGMERDVTLAIRWSELAANSTTQSRSLPRDIQLAREWYQLSADREYNAAMAAIAVTLTRKGVSSEDRVMTKRWLERAFENGQAQAGFLLAVAEMPPLNAETTESAKRAAELLTKSAKMGCIEASAVLERERSGKSLRASLVRAILVPPKTRYLETTGSLNGEDRKVVKNRQPQMIKVAHPVYPETMRLADQEGIVVLQFVVDTSGRVRELKIVSSPDPSFSESAVQAVQQYRFLPGMKEGRSVNVRMQQPIHFNLQESDAQEGQSTNDPAKAEREE